MDIQTWASEEGCEMHGASYCERCSWLTWDADQARAALAWKARCSQSRFCSENEDDPFVGALNAMLAGEDPGQTEMAQLARKLLAMADSESIPANSTLFRGTNGSEFCPGQLDDWTAELDNDQEVTVAQPLVSWTDSAEEWGGWPLLWVLETPTDSLLSMGPLALPLGPFSDRTRATEYVTGGLMNVVRIDPSGPTTPAVVTMTQGVHYTQ